MRMSGNGKYSTLGAPWYRYCLRGPDKDASDKDALAMTGPKIRVPVPRRGAAYYGGGGVRISK